MASIEVDDQSKQAMTFAARVANTTEGEIIRRLIANRWPTFDQYRPAEQGIPIYADYVGHRTRALYCSPARVEIIDGPLTGRSFKTPTGAARAVVRHYNPRVNDSRNGWRFWLIDNGGSVPMSLQSIRPRNSNDPSRKGRVGVRKVVGTPSRSSSADQPGPSPAPALQ